MGKTTLSACFAVEAAKDAIVGLVDLDPQQSLARWWELRGEPDNPDFYDSEERTLKQIVRAAQREKVEWLIIDTPPALMTRIQPAVAVADVVVIPVRPSPLDVEAIEPVIEMCELAKRPFVFVINANPARSSLTKGTVWLLGRERRRVEADDRLPHIVCGRDDHGQTSPLSLIRMARRQRKCVRFGRWSRSLRKGSRR